MRTLHLFAAAFPLCVACSSSSETTTPPGHDAGTPTKDTGTPDHASTHPKPEAGPPKDTGTKEDAKMEAASHKDAVAQDASDGGATAAPPTPVGTAIAKGTIVLEGVTDDGYVIYETATTLEAAPVAGGTPTTILALGDSGAGNDSVLVSHNDVFVWSNPDDNGNGPLAVWSHSLGSLKPFAASSFPYTVAVSADSSAIVYVGSPSADGSTGTVYGVTTAALQTSTSLVAGIDMSGECGPSLSFTGTTAPFVAITGSCLSPTTDGGSDAPEAIAAYPTNTWTPVPLATGATSYWPDTKGTSVAIALATGQLEIAPLAGGTPVDIDTATALSTTAPSLYLSASDAFLLYTTNDGALKSSTVGATPTLTTLAGSKAVDIDAVSLPGAMGTGGELWTLIDQGQDMNTDLIESLSLTSTTAAATPTALVTGSNEAAIIGDAFTTDGKYAVFTSNVTTDANGLNIGTLTAVATAAPTATITLAKTTGSTLASFEGPIGIIPASYLSAGDLANSLLPTNATDLALGNSQLVFVDNFNSSAGNAGQVDIHFIDLSTVTASASVASGTTVMKGADPGYAVSFDKKTIVYTITFGGDTDGLYTVPVPQ